MDSEEWKIFAEFVFKDANIFTYEYISSNTGYKLQWIQQSVDVEFWKSEDLWTWRYKNAGVQGYLDVGIRGSNDLRMYR